jgi:hypothetical protein
VWEGTFAIGDEVRDELVDSGAADTVDRPRATGGRRLSGARGGAAGVLALAVLARFAGGVPGNPNRRRPQAVL